METQRLLGQIENYEIVLPEFQREFTWGRKQSLELIDSLLKGYPIGSLLIWRTANVPALKNMPDFQPNGRVNILLDGQQRLTALYMLVKNKIPPYYSTKDIDSEKDPRNLYYNLGDRSLGYYKQFEMATNPLWVSVGDCFAANGIDLEKIAERSTGEGESAFQKFAIISRNYNALRAILEIPHPIMYVQEDANLYHALTVFDRVNSNGTPLGESDIALAHMCSAWPDTRRVFKVKLAELNNHGFDFDLTFLIRAMNAVVNGRAEYRILHENTTEQLVAGWRVLDKMLDYLVNFLRDRAYIYSSDDLNTSNVLIPILGYLAQNDQKFKDDLERRKLIYWMYAALYQTRYSGSVDQRLERDLTALSADKPVDELISVLCEDHGDSIVTPENLDTRGVSHPIYNMSCILIRAKGGLDWSNGLSLTKPIGQAFSIERHHIFPGSVLENAGYDPGKNLIHRKRVNEIANRVPITRGGNMDIFDKLPQVYLALVESANPGNLEKFMVPMDQDLWAVENYEKFLAARRQLIAAAINDYMQSLLNPEHASTTSASATPSIQALIQKGESDTLEFKSTLRWNIKAQRQDKEMERMVLKTIAAFLNSDGGILLVGVDDQGQCLGLEQDGFKSADSLMLHMTNLVRDRIGTHHNRFIRLTVEEVNEKQVLYVECKRGIVPAYYKDDKGEVFYFRAGPATHELPTSQIHEYVKNRFH